MIATDVDLTDIDYLMKLWKQGQSMRKGSVDNTVQKCTQRNHPNPELHLYFSSTRSLTQ